ncbi:MAG TPA: hypothetical protein VN963_09630 [bacterium]|nr:hypothetical protein [bacterium]
MTVTGAAWGVYSGSGSSGQLSLSGPPAWGTIGTSVLFGWSSLTAALPGGGMDLSAYRGIAFELDGKANRTYAIDGLTETDNGPETVEGRGARLR